MVHFESEGGLKITFNSEIIEVIIGDLLLDPDEARHSTRERALAFLEPLEDAEVVENPSDSADREKDLNREAYRVKITSVSRFKMVFEFIYMGNRFGALLDI